MGMGLSDLEYLSERGHLAKDRPKILDIGSQNLYNASVDRIRAFVDKHGGVRDEGAFAEAAARISYFSLPRPGERTSYISELLDLTDIFYTSYDVCPALKTEIFDLNRMALPPQYKGYFDVVLNFGTTEHVFNQLNSYAVMHDALAVGGIMFHQVPSAGWINHGYFTYHKTFFDDLIHANGYELVDLWYTLAGQSRPDPRSADVRDPCKPLQPRSAKVPELPETVANYNINVVVRKRRPDPFAIGLELATSHSALSDGVGDVYGPERRLEVDGRVLGLVDDDVLEAVRHETEAACRDMKAVRGQIEAVQRDLQESVPFLIEKTVQDVVSEMLPALVRDAVRRTVESDLQGAVSRAVRSAIDEAIARRMLQLNTGAVRDTPTRELVREVGRRFKR